MIIIFRRRRPSVPKGIIMTMPRPSTLMIIAVLTLCTNPSLAQTGDNISFVGTWPAGPCFAGTGADRLVCYGEGAFLVTADVTDPAAPVELGRLQLPYILTEVTMLDELAFVETDEGLWRIFDLTDPSAPQQIGSMPLPGGLYDVDFVGDLAYLGTGTGLHIVDLTDLAAPTIIGTWDDYWSVPHVTVRGDYAYLAAHYGDFQVVDISDPTQPFTVYSDEFQGYGWDVVLVGDYAYVVNGHLRIYDISDPSSPTLHDTHGFSSALFRIVHEGNLLVGTNHTSSSYVITIDTTEAVNPVELGSLYLGGTLRYLVLDAGLLYACQNTAGLRIIDVSTPETPFLAGAFEVFSVARDVAVSGDYCYLVADRSDLHVLDVSDPTEPVHLGRIDLPGDPMHIVIRDHLAYVSSTGAGLLILDLADPVQPTLLSSITVPSNPADICLKANVLFIPGGNDGVYIYDITDPAFPEQLGHFDTYDSAIDVAVFNNLASVADCYGGIRVVDVSDLANPVTLGYYGVPLNGTTVEVVPGLAWLGSSRLVGVDISQPDDPTPIVNSDFTGYVNDLVLRDDLAYIAIGSRLRIVDVSHPQFLNELASYEPLRAPAGLALAGDLIYLATGVMALTIVRSELGVTVAEDTQPPMPARIVDIYPNPFNPRVTIEFVVGRESPVKVTVHDLAGRLVRTLTLVYTAGGRGTANWDGRDRNGRAAAAGVYFCRLVTVHGAETRKMVLVR